MPCADMNAAIRLVAKGHTCPLYTALS